MGPQVEPYADGVSRIVGRIQARIALPSQVTVSETAGVEGHSADLAAIVFDPISPSHRATGTRLTLMALCADRSVWPRIHAAFEAEGFDPITPEPDHGRVFYRSRTRALLIVPENPGAKMAVEKTGRAVLTEVI